MFEGGFSYYSPGSQTDRHDNPILRNDIIERHDRLVCLLLICDERQNIRLSPSPNCAAVVFAVMSDRTWTSVIDYLFPLYVKAEYKVRIEKDILSIVWVGIDVFRTSLWWVKVHMSHRLQTGCTARNNTVSSAGVQKSLRSTLTVSVMTSLSYRARNWGQCNSINLETEGSSHWRLWLPLRRWNI